MRVLPSPWILASLVTVVAPAAAGPPDPGPVPVSPGDLAGATTTISACPTFSWTQTAGAQGYELVVMETSRGDSLDAEPVLRVQLPPGAGSWTPSAEQCLPPDRSYAWLVRATGGAGPASWSEPRLFRVTEGPVSDRASLLALLRAAVADEEIGRELRRLLEVPSVPVRTGGGKPVPGRARTAPSAPAAAPPSGLREAEAAPGLAPKAAMNPRLRVSGDLVAAGGDYTFASPRTLYYAIPPAGFTFVSSTTDDHWYLSNEGYEFVQSGTYPYDLYVQAPVHLPHRATVQAVRCFAYDDFDIPASFDDDLRIKMALYRRPVTSPAATEMALLDGTTHGRSSLIQAYSNSSIAPGTAVIDNVSYQYYVSGFFAPFAISFDLRFYGCEVEATVDRLSAR